ncbi:MAG: insulinase family protein [Clostridium sp.]|uniref:insulinase family protein n=1 Tax=Clostridium sp. TaxID=1506 RepID=UPI003D6D6593
MYDILNVYLENGLRVIMHKIPHVRTMSCGVWIKQGSKHEEDDDNGLSHLVEHLMINIENDNNPRFEKLINEVSSEGIVYNAGTTKETTSYYFTGLSNMLEKCIETLSTIVIDNKTFTNELIENEKKVVSQETISFYSSFNQIKERTSQALWGNVSVGRIIVGNVENINNAKASDIENIIKKSYTPENATLVVVGGIDYQKTLDIIEENFSRWEDTQTRSYKETVDSEPGIYFNSGGSGKSTVISIGFRAPSYMDAEKSNIDSIAKILGDTSLESRLVQEIRMKRGLAYNIGAFTSFYEKRGTLGFTAVCASESVNEVVKIMMDEFHKVFDIIPEDQRKNVALQLSNLMQDKNKINLFELYKIGIEKGFKVFRNFSTATCSCEAAFKNSFIIEPNGVVSPCSSASEDGLQFGELDECGNIKFENKEAYFKFKNTSPLNSEKCKNCVQLPMCMGGCTYSRYKNPEIFNGLVPDGLSLHEKIKLHYYGYIKHNIIEERHII